MKSKKLNRKLRTRKRPLTDEELDRLWDEVGAADEADAGSEADLPEGVPLPETPGSVVAIFIKHRGGSRCPL